VQGGVLRARNFPVSFVDALTRSGREYVEVYWRVVEPREWSGRVSGAVVWGLRETRTCCGLQTPMSCVKGKREGACRVVVVV